MRSLITGAGGFAGSHLADFLLSADAIGGEVWGCDLTSQRRSYHPEALRLVGVDLREPDAVRDLVSSIRPDRVYHLAGLAYAGDSWEHPWETLATNIRAQVNLLEAIVREGLQPRVLVVSSGDVYGRVPLEKLPIDEDFPLQPDSPYSVSKAGQDLVGLQYFLSYGLPVVRVRPFNHIGPRQNRRFVAPAFASQIAEIEAGRSAPLLKVGNLTARRDFTDVRDVVRAYALALEQGEPGEVYNIGSGQSWPVSRLLDVLLDRARVPIEVAADSSRLRPTDMPDLVCESGKLRARTGWTPRYSLEQSLIDLLDYERGQLQAAASG